MFKDCGVNKDQKCRHDYPGARSGTEEYNEVMKVTSALGFFANGGRGNIRDDNPAKSGDTGGPFSSRTQCDDGFYAEVAGMRPSANQKLDFEVKTGKTYKRYHCKGKRTMFSPAAPLPSPLDHCGCNPCQSVLSAL